MTFFSVLLALILEQLRAVSPRNAFAMLLEYHAVRVGQSLDVGRRHYGVLAWLAVALPWTLPTGLIYYLLYKVHFVLAFAWNVVIVYLTLGFRQFSHYFTDIHLALNNDDVAGARQSLHRWTGLDTIDMPVTEIVRHTLVYAVIASHRHVFGVLFWFMAPIGPAGAVLYRVAEYVARRWSEPDATHPAHSPDFAKFARHAFAVLDWLPARLTALGFAIVGNFEDAIHAWRHALRRWPEPNDSVLLAAGGGALGARLSAPSAESSDTEALRPSDGASLSVDDLYTPRTLQSAVGLVWRAVVLWLILLLMLTIAVWVG